MFPVTKSDGTGNIELSRDPGQLLFSNLGTAYFTLSTLDLVWGVLTSLLTSCNASSVVFHLIQQGKDC